MMLDGPDLVARVASRLCHDLISPIGAIGNGVELLALAGNGGAETELIDQSVKLAAARLRLYRIAFGSSTGDQHIPPSEIQAILHGFSPNQRISCHWHCPEGCLRTDAKRVLLGILCLETAMSHGGQVNVTHTPEGWVLHAEASRLRNLSDQWVHLASSRVDMLILSPPSEIQFALLAVTLIEANLTIVTEVSETTIDLRF